MKVFDTPDIRNIALIGHGDSGKTSLASALLFNSGAVNRLGKVDDGTATTDYDDEETDRKISLQTSLAHLEWKHKKINLIDTPGYAAFIADAEVAMAVADTALLLVESVSGVQVITERVFGYAERFQTPIMFVLSKLDRDNASFDRTLNAIHERFGRLAVPIQLPIGKEHDLEGVVNLLTMKACRFAQDGTGKMTQGDIPDDLADKATESRAALVEMVAETDDALMEAFFEAGDLTEEQLLGGLKAAIVQRKIFPVLCSSATHLIGGQPMLDALVNLAPSPAEKGDAVGTNPKDESEVKRPVASDQPVSAFVFKTVADPFAGKLSLLRVMTGTLRPDSSVINVGRDGVAERLGNLAILQGKQTTPVGELKAGDLGVIAKLKETQTSDTLAEPANPILYAPVTFPEPAISYAVEPKSKGDEEKISTALARLMEEDPVLRVRRDARSAELLVSGTGQVHVEVALSKMKRKFGVEAVLHTPKVPYFETIKKKAANIEGKHKKQSGGRGQFGVCVIDMEPLPQGSGFEFVDKIFGGSIPQNYRPAVEKGIKESAERGWLAGSPVIDFRVTLTDGKYHNVDSSEMAFKIAGSLAFKEAMQKSKPTILEPIMQVEIVVPEENMGDIMGDLSSRRGKPQGMEAQGHNQIIKAQVPMSEMLDYASTLKSLTSDRGTYTMELDHYDEVPSQIQQKIIEEHRAAKGAGRNRVTRDFVYIDELADHVGESVSLNGWLAQKRSSGKIKFLVLRDGSGFLQCVAFIKDVSQELFECCDRVSLESSIRVTGTVREDKRAPGGFELSLEDLQLLHGAEEYPIQPKEHGVDFLFDKRHLYLRSRTPHSVLQVRHQVVQACRDYFNQNGFVLIDSPMLTPAACEGTTTLFETDYFGDRAYLTQSGQLYLEPACMAFGRVYCFGPTFRAEKSKTRRHLTEFWMVEPEVAFMELPGLLELAEEFVSYIVARVLDRCGEALRYLERDTSKLENIRAPFPRMTYAEASKVLLMPAAQAKMKEAGAPPFVAGSDFGGFDETLLTSEFDRPVMVTHWPAEIKAFYMQPEDGDPSVARCLDMLAPEGYGEIIGGSQRIHDHDLLLERIRQHDLPVEAFQWYLDIRKYGTVPHSGFGMGIERCVTWLCGIPHLREAIPYPRQIHRIYP